MPQQGPQEHHDDGENAVQEEKRAESVVEESGKAKVHDRRSCAAEGNGARNITCKDALQANARRPVPIHQSDPLYSALDSHKRPGKAVGTAPKVVISTRDAERLEALLESMRGKSFPGKAELEAELDRADVVEPQEMPPTVVTMNSTVKFRVQSSQEEFQLTLVYPRDVDQSGGTISVLAPVGSALLGLSQGDEIEWPKPGGGTIRVRIEEIL